MNGTSGFHEVRSSTSRSPSHRFLQEQRHRFGSGAWRLFDTHDAIASSTGISTKRDNVHELASLNRRIGLLTVSHPRR